MVRATTFLEQTVACFSCVDLSTTLRTILFSSGQIQVPEQESAELYQRLFILRTRSMNNLWLYLSCAEISYDRVFIYFPTLFVRFEELCAFLAPVFLVVRALEDCRGIDQVDF